MIEQHAGARRVNSSFFATVAIACFAYATLALLLMHVLRPDYAPASHMISDYAVGPYGWVMTTTFLAMSCGCSTLLLGLVRLGPRSASARVGTLLLGIASIGLVVSAIFPTDVAPPSTRTGDIHDISFLVNVTSNNLGNGIPVGVLRQRFALASVQAHVRHADILGGARTCPSVPHVSPRRSLRAG